MARESCNGWTAFKNREKLFFVTDTSPMKQDKKNFFIKTSFFSKVLWGLVIIGILIYTKHYLDNLSIWADEAWLAIELNRRTLSQILLNQNLSLYYSIPPVGFLAISEILLNVFGNTERILRFFPYCCSILAVFQYRNFLKKYFSLATCVIALTLFVFHNSIIFYAVQFKQYACDLLISILIFEFTFQFLLKPLKYIHLMLLSIAGFLCLSISHPSIFCLSGIAVTQTVILIKNKQPIRRHLILFGIWALAFLFLYFNYYEVNFTNPHINAYHHNTFLTPDYLLQYVFTKVHLTADPFGINLPLYLLPIFLAGLFRFYQKDAQKASLLIAPVILTVLASILQKYPFHGRFLLFLLPVFFIFIAEGFMFFWEGKILKKIIGLILIAFFLTHGIWDMSKNLTSPKYIAETRPLLKYLKTHLHPGDSIILNNQAQYAYWYYLAAMNCPYAPKIKGIFADHLNEDKNGRFLYFARIVNGIKQDIKIYASGKIGPGKINPPKNIPKDFIEKGRVWFFFAQADQETETLLMNIIKNKTKELAHQEEPGAQLILVSF